MKMNSRKILITGGCGFLGMHLLRCLIQEGWQSIYILDNLTVGSLNNLENVLLEIAKYKKHQLDEQRIRYELECQTTIEVLIGDVSK